LEAIPWTRFTVEAQASWSARALRLNGWALGSVETPARREVEEEDEAEEKPAAKRVNKFMAREIVTIECTEARKEGKSPSRYNHHPQQKAPTEKVRAEE